MRKLLMTGALALSMTLAAAAGATAETKLSVEATPVAELMANEKAKAVLEKHIPGIGAHPSYDMFKGMTLVELKPYSEGQITDETLAAIKSELATD
ncbi:MAG: hypothetical protein Q8M38_07765 [Phenylobacterium sp.]|uniref:hypothetical protein n=1 Tax=Phenylobacterium sp. TaxID=1871053 RepID=UPI00273152F4|nr:hypothetical protein [Phenylobacterium sp.]MDP1616485.1 hypothetical protein [Phenylobacterium sp.]MDP1988032.1 hypothetical protein [Phenylobacterium sp.]MDP3299977.1 hypothetical protein [Phenylobacterium sp.]